MTPSKSIPKYAALTMSVLLAFTLVGCKNESQQSVQRPPQAVSVVTASVSSPVLTQELNGRTSAYEIAEVRPQVGGIIKERTFKEGQMVKAGDQLYQIDDRLYQAAYDEALAAYNLAQVEARRCAQLVKVNAISKQENDKAQANLKTAKAALQTAKTNLEYTKVLSPISGRVGRSEVTPGSLVTAYQANYLTTVQRLDPIYVDVRQTSTDLLKLKRDVEAGKVESKDGAVEVSLLSEDGLAFEQKGKLIFTGELVDENTGMVNLRAEFPNPKGELLPGMFVRARIEEGARPSSILLSQRCVMRNPKGQAYVYVVTSDNTIEQRFVVTNRTVGTDWLIESGLKEGERVVIEGIQKVRPGATVQVANDSPTIDKTEEQSKVQ